MELVRSSSRDDGIQHSGMSPFRSPAAVLGWKCQFQGRPQFPLLFRRIPMLNRIVVVGLMLPAMAWFLPCTSAAQEPRPGADLRFKAIVDALEQPIDVKDLMIPNALKEVLAVLSGKIAQ